MKKSGNHRESQEIPRKVRKSLKIFIFAIFLFFFIKTLFSGVSLSATPTYSLEDHNFSWKSPEQNANQKKFIFLIF